MDKIVAAVISACVTSIGFLITYRLTIRKSRQEMSLFEKKLFGKYGEKLFEMRLKNYGAAFEITDMLGKPSGFTEEQLPVQYKATLDQLRDWKKGEVNLVLSDQSIDAYYELIEVLPCDKAVYSAEQKELIWNRRDTFRRSLRKDLGLLRKVDETQF